VAGVVRWALGFGRRRCRHAIFTTGPDRVEADGTWLYLIDNPYAETAEAAGADLA
jgi:hypothetical protein